jgi:enterochelin esterase-like enzyme
MIGLATTFKKRQVKQTVRLFLVVALFFISPAILYSQDPVQAENNSTSRDVAWVTARVEIPRVSFHRFKSEAAKAEVSYHVYTPLAYDNSDSTRFPVLYWLHGTEGGTNYIRPVARMFHVAIRDNKVPPMIVVFVNGLPKHLWTDSKDGKVPVETVFIKELIPRVDKSFRTIASREGRILEGFSMGGYGAARIGFKHVDLFGGISILAGGPLDIDFEGPRATGNPLREKILNDVCNGDLKYFQETHPITIAKLQAEKLRESGVVVRQAVGSKDFSLLLNRKYHEHLESLKIPHEFHIVEGVGHDTPGLMAGLSSGEFYRKALKQKP